MTAGTAADQMLVPCLGCDRPIKSASGRARGRGERCWRKHRRKVRIAQAAAATPVRASDAGLDGPDLFEGSTDGDR